MKKIPSVLLLCITFLPVVACDANRELKEYKATAKEALDIYVTEKGQDNYTENGRAICKAVTYGNQAI